MEVETIVCQDRRSEAIAVSCAPSFSFSFHASYPFEIMKQLTLPLLLCVLLLACSERTIAPLPEAVTIDVFPKVDTLRPGMSVRMRAVVKGTTDTAVTWRLRFGSFGTIDSTGYYTAPAPWSGERANVIIEAASRKYPNVVATAQITLIR